VRRVGQDLDACTDLADFRYGFQNRDGVACQEDGYSGAQTGKACACDYDLPLWGENISDWVHYVGSVYVIAYC
jgi:hypothetical protein